MKNEKGELIDSLRRAHEMEEDMACILVELCEGGSPDITGGENKRLKNMLGIIKEDTFKHKALIEGILQELSGVGE